MGMGINIDTATKQQIRGWLGERTPRFTAISDEIWRKPQLALAETEACAIQSQELAREGFRITANVGGMPTAFMAEWGNGAPVIGFLGEYDALPGLSQQAQPTPEPVVAGGPGHGCGHNLLGTGAMAAAMALKAWIEATGRTGTVRYYGCPAEETLIGKVYMARTGIFDDLDAAITWHPWGFNTVSKGSFSAMDNLKFRFHGKTAHAAGNPQHGRSALDAVELMNVGVNFMREHVIEQARIHYVITNGGGAPNVVPAEAEVWYFVRAPEREQVEGLTARVRKIAQGAALMTETTVEEDVQGGCFNVLPNFVLADLAHGLMEEVGPIAFTADEQSYGETVIAGFPEGTREAQIGGQNLPLSLLEQPLTGAVQPIFDEGKVMAGSTDVADVSWITPTVTVLTTCHPAGIPGHSWGITATSGMSIGHKGMLQAADVMALTGAALFDQPDLLERARAEFQERTAGRPYRSPLAPDAKPPLPPEVAQ